VTELDLTDLPHNWSAASLADITDINPKLDKTEVDDGLEVSFVPMSSLEAATGRIDVSGTRKLREVRKGYTQFQDGDVLFAKITPCMENGKMAVVHSLKNGLGFGSTEFHVLRPFSGIDARYVYYFVSAQRFRHDAERNMAGAVGQQRVPTAYLAEHVIPVPPTQEQTRIVTKIEELLSELDNGLRSLLTARKQLRVYRQALLKTAFEGKMTAQWRDDNSTNLESADSLLIRIKKNRDTEYQKQLKKWKVLTDRGQSASKPRPPSYAVPFSDEETRNFVPLPDNWRWAKLGDLFGVYVGATPSRKNSRYWGGSVNWVSSGEVRFRRISSTREKITLEGLENTSTECHPAGTVMLAMIGEGKTRGQAAILDINACHNQNTAAIRVSETDCLPEYLYYYLLFQYQITRTLGSGNNQKALNKDRVSNMRFPLAPVNEQRELVAAIEARMSVIDRVEEDIELEVQKAEVLRQSILKKAFSGKLVAQDCNDEPASVLLTRIRTENAEEDVSKQKSRRKDAA
jgi:type I restriction enzyme S subunit